MDLEYLQKLISIFAEGIGVLFKIFILTLIFSVPLGVGVALASNSKSWVIRKIIRIYILIMRGTPLILQIICIYFAPYYLFNISYDRFIAVIIAFVINFGAYFGEIFRGGINSIPKGQMEAAITLGFNKSKAFILIILPQVIKQVLPAISNEVITLVRDTSLAQVIGIAELFSLAQKQANFKFSILPLILAGGIYLAISYLITLLFNIAEKKLNYYRWR